MKELNQEDRILEAALDVVQEKTISGTRMHLIANQVNMVQSNLHYYFKTKEDLLLGLQEKVIRKCHELREEDKKDATDCLEDQLDVFFKQKKQFILQYQKFDFAEVDFWVQARTNEKIQQAFKTSFEGWRNDIGEIIERFCPEVNKESRKLICAVMVSMLEGSTMQYLIDEQSFNLDQYFECCKDGILKLIEGYRASENRNLDHNLIDTGDEGCN